MSTTPAEAETSASSVPGFIGGFMDKFGVQMNMKTGLIIAAIILVITYVGYTWIYPKFIKSEGMDDGSGGKKSKKKKSDGGDEKDDSKKEISDLVDKIETKQSKNIDKK